MLKRKKFLAAIKTICTNDLLLTEGGLNAWKKAGFEIKKMSRNTLPLDRQTQIVAGLLAFWGVVAINFAQKRSGPDVYSFAGFSKLIKNQCLFTLHQPLIFRKSRDVVIVRERDSTMMTITSALAQYFKPLSSYTLFDDAHTPQPFWLYREEALAEQGTVAFLHEIDLAQRLEERCIIRCLRTLAQSDGKVSNLDEGTKEKLLTLLESGEPWSQ